MKPGATLGILAGGQATRLGGIDKAWLERDGVPQVERIATRLRGIAPVMLVSANRQAVRYARLGLHVVPDRHAGLGPIGGLDALANACDTSWLFTVPVDVLEIDTRVFERLAAAGEGGALARDDSGVQPLVACWPVGALRDAAAVAIAEGALSVQALQQRLAMPCVRIEGMRFGNLNTPADLAHAGMAATREARA